jgi:serine/threonine protein kinase HipA of HipAB toxin-antitoxin module
MNDENIVHVTELNVSGKSYSVQVFSRDNGKFYSFTQLGESDVIIIDGTSIEDVLERCRFSLPLAINCRIHWPKQTIMKYPNQSS